jgi:hypothetical protein
MLGRPDVVSVRELLDLSLIVSDDGGHRSIALLYVIVVSIHG